MPQNDVNASKKAVAGTIARAPEGPSVSNLSTALQTANPSYWTTARLNAATKLDLIYAARLAGLSVAGL